jgi:hypothetical protein
VPTSLPTLPTTIVEGEVLVKFPFAVNKTKLSALFKGATVWLKIAVGLRNNIAEVTIENRIFFIKR